MHPWSLFLRNTACTRLRASIVIALSLALATLAAIWRSLHAPFPAPGPPLFSGYPALLFGIAMLAAGAAYVQGLREEPEPLKRRHLFAAMAIQLCAAPAPPFTSTDALMNLAYGRLAVLGHNPYETPPRLLPEADPYRTHLDWSDSTNAWGPIPLVASAFAARQPSQTTALLVFKLLMLGAVLLSLIIAFRYSRSLPPEEAGIAFFFYGSNPLLAWELSGQAHNDALLVLGSMAFVWASYARKGIAAFVLLFVGFLTKYGSAPVLGLYWSLLWRESRRQFVFATALAVGLCGLVWLPFFESWGALQGLSIAALPDPNRIVNSLASFASLAESLTDAPIFRLWSLGWLCLAGVAAVRYAMRAKTFARVMRDSLSFSLLYQVLVMPCYWPWYATWLLPLALARDNSHQRLTVAVFCSLAPALYLSGVAGGMAILVVHGVALSLWLAAERKVRA